MMFLQNLSGKVLVVLEVKRELAGPLLKALFDFIQILKLEK